MEVKPMFAVIPARNEAERIAHAVRTVRQSGAMRIIAVVNGCEDNTLDHLRHLQGDDMTLLNFREPLGVDIPRAIGAAYALHKGAEHVLFYDGDLIGPHLDELRRLVRSTQRFSVDLALTDPYGTARRDHSDLAMRLRADLSQRLGLYPRLGLSNPAHGPHIVSRRLLTTLPLPALATPPTVLTLARQHDLKIDSLAHIPHPRLGSAHKGPVHHERIRETIIGDLLTALALLDGRPPSRDHCGRRYDGYHSERRFDLLERFLQKL
jgi:glycosyltransferase involved in cell wall biosynthesis